MRYPIKQKMRKSLAILLLQVSRNMKSIAAGSLSRKNSFVDQGWFSKTRCFFFFFGGGGGWYFCMFSLHETGIHKKKTHKHKSFWPVTPLVRGQSPGRERLICYPRTPRNSGTCKRGRQKGVSLICSENKSEEIRANQNTSAYSRKQGRKSEQIGRERGNRDKSG